MPRHTTVSIQGRAFHINGRPTCEGRTWRGHRIEGLLMNARMVQATFDDLNPDTRAMWAYPDGPWDAERNVAEFLAAMPEWRRHGLLAFTVNLQGGSPVGYPEPRQPWHNSAFEADGSLRPDTLSRLQRVLDRADELGMVAIVGYFYFGQDERLADEAAVVRAVDDATDWLCDAGYANVLVEIGNEVNHPRYEHAIIRMDRCHELIERVQRRSRGRVASPAGRLLVSTSPTGAVQPPEAVIAAADFVLLHGNSIGEGSAGHPDGIRGMVDRVRSSPAYRDQPIVFNEDDHFDFGAADNHMIAAVSRYASWGYFDYRMAGEGFDEGYQSPPVAWGITSDRKRGFFRLLAEMTGEGGVRFEV